MHNIHNIMEIVQLNANAKLSEHFTLGEFTKSGSHPEVYNIPSHEAIANLANLSKWLEVLRERAGTPIVMVWSRPSAMRPSLSTTRKKQIRSSTNS